jgi:hypothetical protein
MPAFADFVGSTGTEGASAQAAINKTLKMPIGTITPNATFSFKIDAVSVDGAAASDPVSPTNMPAIGTKTIAYTTADTSVAAGGVITISKELNIAPAANLFPHAGIYKYTVAELKQVTPGKLIAGELMYYSDATYELTFYVSNGTSGLFIEYIECKKLTDDADIAVNAKVDPTPKSVSGTDSQFLFTNIFTRDMTTVDEEGIKTADIVDLTISKTVAGLGANQAQAFPFIVTITKPAVGVAGTPIYKGQIMAGSTPVGGLINFTSGTPTSVNLTHGQKLVFNNLETGASYVVKELADAAYIAQVDVTSNGAVPVNTDNGEVNEDLVLSSEYITQGTDSADFTNTRELVAPTGISINDLPYFVLIGLTCGLAALFALIRYRKKEEGAESLF